MSRDHTRTRPSHGFALAALTTVASLACAACGDDEPGTLEVSISGESFALTGWPVEQDGETSALDDGWTVRFEAVIVSVADFTLSDRDGQLSGLQQTPILVDLHRLDAVTQQQKVWTFEDVPAQRWDDVGYSLVPATDDARVVGTIDDERVAAMIEAGASMYIAGYADQDGDESTEDDTYRFEWLITGEAVNTRCLNGTDESYGVVVEAGQVNEAQMTFHFDHLLWDNHDVEEPHLLFEAYAAASALAARAAGEEDDRIITLSELKLQDLADLRGLDGGELTLDGQRVVYRPRAGADLPEDTLADYLVDAALSTGHFNGEGHCEYAVSH